MATRSEKRTPPKPHIAFQKPPVAGDPDYNKELIDRIWQAQNEIDPHW